MREEFVEFLRSEVSTLVMILLGQSVQRGGVDLAPDIDVDRGGVPGGSGHHGDALILPLDMTHTGHGLCHHLAALDVAVDDVRTGLTVQSGSNNVLCGDWTGLL